MSNLDLARGRSTVLNLTNQSGSQRSPGDVVVLSTANDESFITSTSSNYSSTQLGIVDEPISVGSNGRVVIEGYARQVNVVGTASRGENLYQSTTAAKAAGSAIAPPLSGAFGQFLKGGTGTQPSATIFSATNNPSITGSVGSNSTDVAGSTAIGGITTYAPAAHWHKGVLAVTSSSSNTLQQPIVNLRPGANVAFGLTDTDGNGAFDTLTISSTGGSGGGGGGSNLASASYTRSSGDYTGLTSTTFTNLDNTNLNLSITTGARRVLILVQATVSVNGTNVEMMIDIEQDGTRIGGDNGIALYQAYTANASGIIAIHWLTDALSAASHTFKVQYRVSSGTGIVYGNTTGSNTTPLRFAVIEQYA